MLLHFVYYVLFLTLVSPLAWVWFVSSHLISVHIYRQTFGPCICTIMNVICMLHVYATVRNNTHNLFMVKWWISHCILVCHANDVWLVFICCTWTWCSRPRNRTTTYCAALVSTNIPSDMTLLVLLTPWPSLTDAVIAGDVLPMTSRDAWIINS